MSVQYCSTNTYLWTGWSDQFCLSVHVQIGPSTQFNFLGKAFSLSFPIPITDLLCQIGYVTWLKLMTFSYFFFFFKPNKAKCKQITQDTSMTNQSVLLSIFYCSFVVKLWRKQVQERSPAFPGGSQDIPRSERIYVIPQSSGSAWSLFPSSLNPSVSLNKSSLSIKQFSSMNLLIFLSGCCIWAKIWKSFLICHPRRGRKVISIHPFSSIHLWSDCRTSSGGKHRYPSSQQHSPSPPEEFPVQRWYITPLASFGSATRSPSSDTCQKKKGKRKAYYLDARFRSGGSSSTLSSLQK